jgi:hypothetical protein
MADQINFVLALIDKISSPAKAASAALATLESSLKRVEQLTKRVGSAGSSKSAGPMPAIPAATVQSIKLTSQELEVLKQRLRDDKLAVTNLTASLRQMKDAGMQSTGALALLEKQLKEKKSSLGALQEKLVLSGHAAEFGSEGTNRLTTTLRELSSSGGAGDAVVMLHQAIGALSAAIDSLKVKLGQAGVVGKAFNGILFGVATTIGERLANAIGDAFVDRMADRAGKMATAASEQLSKRFQHARGFKGRAGMALASSSKLAGEVLGGSISGDTLKSAASAMGALITAAAGLAAAFVGIAVVAAAVVAVIGLMTIATGALAVAMVGLTIKGASLAIEASEAKNDTLDMLEAMLGSAEAAHSALDSIRNITSETSASQKSVESAASALVAAGLENQSLMIDAVRSIAQVDSVLAGKGEKIQSIFEKAAQSGKFDVKAKQLAGTGIQMQKLYVELAKRTGVGVKQVEAQLKAGKVSAEVGIAALTKVIDDRFGDLAKKQALDIGPQWQRFKDNIGRLFEDVNPGPFLQALGRVFALFDQSAQAGGGMRDMVVAVFDGIFSAVARVEPYATKFLKGLVIIALQVAIAFKPLIKSLHEAFGGEAVSGPVLVAKAMSLIGKAAGYVVSVFASVAASSTTWSVIGYVLKGILVVIGLVTAGLGVFAVGVGMLLAPFWLLVSAITTAIGWLINLAPAAIEAGGALVSGLIEGVKNAAGMLYETVKNLAKGALDTFKTTFGIQSPSKVMARMGGHLSVGLAQGISAGARAPQLAMAGVLSRGPANTNYIGPAPSAAPPRLAAQRQSSGGRQFSVTFAEGSVQVTTNDIAGFREQMPEIMANVFEQVALMNGTD